MNIIVTGASGFIGSSLIKALSAAGHTGCAVSRRLMTGLPIGWQWVERQHAMRDEWGKAGGALAPDCVIHLEVKQHVIRPSSADCEEFESVNVRGTRQWLNWCERRDVLRFAYFSTIKAVGDSTGCQDEEADSEPSTPYGQSKRVAEGLVRAWSAAKPERTSIIFRPAVIYGPGNKGNVFAMVEAIDRGCFYIIGCGDNVKSLVSINNVAAAVVFLLRENQPGCHVYNVVDRESYTVCDLVDMIMKEMGCSRTVKSLPLGVASIIALLGDAAFFVGLRFPLNQSRLKALVETTYFSCAQLVSKGFVHPQSTKAGLAEMVHWYRSIS